ncbi:hypothetical protein FOA52_007842 [Chlamydomonas sp. UWO 241]|nr:hypothetical protein FOA52_007842 [Chlamydomonas sp. UWO 241]
MDQLFLGTPPELAQQAGMRSVSSMGQLSNNLNNVHLNSAAQQHQHQQHQQYHQQQQEHQQYQQYQQQQQQQGGSTVGMELPLHLSNDNNCLMFPDSNAAHASFLDALDCIDAGNLLTDDMSSWGN